jgi:hypothetical protein
VESKLRAKYAVGEDGVLGARKNELQIRRDKTEHKNLTGDWRDCIHTYLA